MITDNYIYDNYLPTILLKKFYEHKRKVRLNYTTF